MSSIPPAAITSASETLATVTPIAPARRKRCAIAGHLNALACGRQAIPRDRKWPSHEVDVVLERLEVDQEGRRIQLAHRQADRAELHFGRIAGSGSGFHEPASNFPVEVVERCASRMSWRHPC